MNNKLLILLTVLTISSCSLLERRDFSDQMDYAYDEPLFKPNSDFMVMAGDSGRDFDTYSEIMDRTPASAQMNSNYRYEKSLLRELNHLERKLQENEYYEYTRYKSRLGSTSEKIYYLRLLPHERNEYLRLRNIESRSQSMNYVAASQQPAQSSYNTRYKSDRDITLGMSQSEAVNNWGAPERRDIDGDPVDQNERWAYRKNGRIKYIYFESGKVQGWSEQ